MRFIYLHALQCSSRWLRTDVIVCCKVLALPWEFTVGDC